MSAPRPCRMFPLGSVLMPHGPLPLHVFEPRYQALLNESLEDDRTFGVALITRGFEVGGGDTRSDVGTLAHIDDYSRFDDGRAALVCRGVSRIRIVEWLADDPYPRAMVIDLEADDPVAADGDRFSRAEGALAELVELAREQGRLETVPSFEWPDDLDLATWQMASIAPISAFDRQRVLAASSIADRLGVIEESIRAMSDDLRRMSELDDE